jgi:HD-GYP domain-containing protein (c-di-GMP phosphodiesterase class II)
MLLARSLYDKSHRPVFKEGAYLGNTQVEAIKRAGYAGAYVLDARADKVVPAPLVPDMVYLYAAQFVEHCRVRASRGEARDAALAVEEQEGVVQAALAALASRQHRFVDSIDTKPYAGYSSYHAAMVMTLSLAMGLELGLGSRQLFDLGVAALLHDMANAYLPPLHDKSSTFLPAVLFNRPGRLTDEESEAMRVYMQKGYDYLVRAYALSASASLGVMQYHENYNGTGYPNGLRRKKISLYARIIAIADAYDALVSKRSFRTALYPSQALDMVMQQSDRKFDPDIVDVFERIIAPYPTGTLVQLKTDERCLVLRNHPDNLARPLLRVYGPYRTFVVDTRTDPAYRRVRILKAVG